MGFSSALEEDMGAALPEVGRAHLERVKTSAARMNDFIDALLALSRVGHGPFTPRTVDISSLAGEVMVDLKREDNKRSVHITVEPGMVAQADPQLVRVLLTNVLSNA